MLGKVYSRRNLYIRALQTVWQVMYDAFTRHSSNLQKHCINAISIWRYFEISVFGETNNVCRLSKVMVVTRSNCVVLWKMHRRWICVHVSCICFRWTVTNLSWDFMHCTNERKRKLISKYQQTKAIFERRKYNLERLCWKQTYHWSYNWKYCTLINWLCQKFE